MCFESALSFGKTGEGFLAHYLIRSGFSVLPVYEIEQGQFKGPSVYTSAGNFVAPDMMAFSSCADFEGETCFFVEAKTKSAFTLHRKTGRFVTGISKRHFEDYIQVQSRSPFTIWIMFLQLNGGCAKDSPQGPTGLYGATVSRLMRNVNHEWIAPRDRDSMVYWAAESLSYFASLDDVKSGRYHSASTHQQALL